jgi:hypothetical protein
MRTRSYSDRYASGTRERTGSVPATLTKTAVRLENFKLVRAENRTGFVRKTYRMRTGHLSQHFGIIPLNNVAILLLSFLLFT